MYVRILIAALVVTAAAPASAEKLYKWVDEQGVVHYGDRVPAQYAKTERHILNEHGITVGTLERELSPEELAVRMRAAELERLAIEEKRLRVERDRILLTSYLNVEEIEMVRDRRIMTLEAQIQVNEHHLLLLRDRLLMLEEHVREFNYPFDAESERPPLPDDLAEDIIETAQQMNQREQDLEMIRAEQSRIRQRFAEDIDRFQELKSVEAAISAYP